MVTHKMLEILATVARMPERYRHVRKAKLISDYEPHLIKCSYAWEAFQVLVGDIDQNSISDEGLACYRSVQQMAVRDAETVY